MRLRLRIGHDHRDREARTNRARREPLVPVYIVVVAFARGARRQMGRVGTRRFRLGHRKAGACLAFKALREPLFLLIGIGEIDQDLHVPSVGRHAIEGARSDRAASHDLAERRVFGDLQPLAVFFVGHEKIPEAGRLGLAPHLLQDLGLGVLLAMHVHLFIDLLLDRIDVLIHEGGDLPLIILHFGRELEIHRCLALRVISEPRHGPVSLLLIHRIDK